MGELKRWNRTKKTMMLAIVLLITSCLGCGKGSDTPISNGKVESGENSDASNQDSTNLVVEEGDDSSTQITDLDQEVDLDQTMTKEEYYQEMIQRTLVSTGNNYRMKKAIEKAQNGEDVTIAYIGGSITEGANSAEANNYVTLSYEYFRDTYAKDPSKVHLINGGMSGTPSSLGVIRYERDVLQESDIQPDVIFIEFAVNDYLECTSGRAYEGLIRRGLKAENQPAIVLVFSVFKSRWNMQDNYIPDGNYYKLPMVSISNGVNWALDDAKFLSEKEYFSDDYHPTDNGHKIMSDSIAYLWDTIAAEEIAENDITVPEEPLHSDAFENMHMITSAQEGTVTVDGAEVTVSSGSFNSIDTTTAKFNYSGNSIFPNNFMHDGTLEGNESFAFQANCKNLMIVYKSSSSEKAGSIDVLMDGETISTITSYNPSGWNNAETTLVFSEIEADFHTFEIRMKDGDEAKDFTIYALGYGN